jgi:hypothetical protein
VIASVHAALFVRALIIGIIIGFVCLWAATTFQRKYGRPPWGVPGWGWFIIGFILEVLGLILYLIAYFTSKSQATPSGYAPPAYPPPPPPPSPQQSWSQQVGTPPPPPPPGSGPPRYPGSGPPSYPGSGSPPSPDAPPPVEGPAEQPPPPE